MIARVHVVKVPSTEQDFFPYSHFADEHSAGPVLELFMDGLSGGYLRVSGLAKLKPNFQTNPKLRIDLYGPHHGLINIANSIIHVFGHGDKREQAAVDPEKYRLGPQTLPVIEQQYRLAVSNVEGKCYKYFFTGAQSVYFDHEFPKSDHIEMKGKEFHLGIPLKSITKLDSNLGTVEHNVPEVELRKPHIESNPVTFSPLTIRISFTADELRDFASTVLDSYNQETTISYDC